MQDERRSASSEGSKWRFPSAVFESVGSLFRKKEVPFDIEAEKKKFVGLDGLRNTDKKFLLSTYRSLSGPDSSAKPDNISQHVIDLFVDEVVEGGDIAICEIEAVAPIFVEEIRNRPKKQPKNINPESEKDRVELLSYRIIGKLKGIYEDKKIFGQWTAEDEEKLEPKVLQARALHIAEKICKAPREFGPGLDAYMGSLDADIQSKEKDFLTRDRVALDPKIVQKIFELHPNDYEQLVGMYEEVFARAALLEASGMTYEAGILRELDISFSPIDGVSLRTPQERLAYIEEIKDPSTLKAKWRQERVKTGYKRDLTEGFVATQAIPELLGKGVSYEDVIKQMHWFHVAGGYDQIEARKHLKRNIAGEYRQEPVSVGNYPAPNEKLVLGMMEKLIKQAELFSAQLEALRDKETPESFEQKAHQLACHISHQFMAIHPMVDGNGRTGRSLRDYIIAKHLGVEKISEYKGYGSAGVGYKVFECFRGGQSGLTNDQIETFYGSELATRYRTVVTPEENRLLGPHHESLMAHLGETDITQEVFNNKDIVEFAARLKDIIDGKNK